MRGSRFERSAGIASFVMLASVLASAAPVLADPIDAANAACRAAIAKSVGKLANATMKAFDGCIQAALKGDSVDCTTFANADLKGAVAKAQTKVEDTIAASCNDVTHAVALSELERCGPPNGSHISSFSDLAGCYNDMVPQNIEGLRNFILRPDFGTQSSGITKCVKAISKHSTKIFKTVQKVKHRETKEWDSLGGDSNYYDPGDPDFKINDALGKALESIYGSCENLTNVEWIAINSCDNDPLITPLCALQNVLSSAEGVSAAAYDLPGICPSSLTALVLDGAEGGIVKRATEMDVGWTGVQHDTDTNEFFSLGLNVDCGSFTDNDCTTCTLTAGCDDGNCRCSNDPYVFCDEPFSADVDDCAGADCHVFLDAPLPTWTAGIPVCTVQRLESLDGTAAFDNGAVSLNANLRRTMYIGSQSHPCPTCEEGLCVGGARNGLACDPDTVSEFGDVSYDCLPAPGASVTGLGMVSTIELGTAPSSLAAALPCDAPLGAYDCPCSACSGDPSIACTSDSVCTTAGAGVCGTSTAQHLGKDRKPNECSDLVCTPASGSAAEGECLADDQKWCDGIVKGNGDGVVMCTVQADCDANPGAGLCSQTRKRPCFLDPITADGSGGPVSGVDNGVLASTHCVPTSSVAYANNALGLPGPARMTLSAEFYSLCLGGFGLWSPGGALCQF